MEGEKEREERSRVAARARTPTRERIKNLLRGGGEWFSLKYIY